MKRSHSSRGRAALSLAILSVLALLMMAMQGANRPLSVIGGGVTMITGGNGAAVLEDLTPAITRFSIHAVKPKGGVAGGRFECVALVPPAAAGPGSGEFSENIMYVAGIVTGLEQLDKNTVKITGQGPCTGLGAGDPVNFEATVTQGGPGARLVLTVDTLPGIVFDEIVTEGSIEISNKKDVTR